LAVRRCYPETNDFPYLQLFPTRTIVLTKQVLQELQERHDVADTAFLVDGPPWLQAALFEENLRFQHVTHGDRDAAERMLKLVRQQTEQFANYFCNPSAEPAETWLLNLRAHVEPANLSDGLDCCLPV
jgi:transposase-like protein